jgi:hypothetical protein
VDIKVKWLWLEGCIGLPFKPCGETVPKKQADMVEFFASATSATGVLEHCEISVKLPTLPFRPLFLNAIEQRSRLGQAERAQSKDSLTRTSHL